MDQLAFDCHKVEQDPDDIKLQPTPGHGRPAETCCICGIRDGRELPDSWRGRPLCKPCGDVIEMMTTYMRIRCVDVAIHNITDTGEDILKALRKQEVA